MKLLPQDSFLYYDWELFNDTLPQGVSKAYKVKVEKSKCTYWKLKFWLWLDVFLIPLEVYGHTQGRDGQ